MSVHLHTGLRRGSKNATDTEGELENASFEDPAEILKAGSLAFSDANPEGRIFLGLIGAEVHRETLPSGRVSRYAVGGRAVGFADDRHLMTIAGSRSGKSVSAIIPNLLRYPGSTLVIDPKGELACRTARHRSNFGNVHVLDPFDVVQGNATKFKGSFNPMSILDRESKTLVEDAGLIADGLVVPSPGREDNHWDESAKHFIEGLILHVATHSSFKDQRNLTTVYRLLMIADEGLRKDMEESPVLAVAEAARGFWQKSDKERDSVLSTARRHARFLGYQSMEEVLRSSSFDLRDLKTGTTTIYLCLPALRLGTVSQWLRIIVNLTLAMMEYHQEKPRYPVLMVLDEFAILSRMESIEKAIGQIAGLGVLLWIIIQDLSQLSIYGKKSETMLGNCGILQFFGNSEPTTLEWIEKRLGKTIVSKRSQHDVTFAGRTERGETGISHSTETHPLITAEEASRFFGRDDNLVRQLIIRPSYSPMILQRACYYKDDRFRGQWDAD
ncbi:MAG: type IV secretory system conjugative DNA transfer family protein [Verrucomicrobiae bacterium]|nr:type IV secretory system conjugative DNA transfer family protein [Verrucomicrobiae bacterium]